MANNINNNQLRVGVVGVGPVGLTLAAHLIDAGAYVVPCDIDRAKIDKIKKDGIYLENVINKEVTVTEACYSVDELAEQNLDLVAVSVKTPCLEKILPSLKKIASDRLYVMSVQNGLDTEQEIAKVFGKERTLRMIVNYAGGVKNLNTVNVIFFNAPNYIAALSPEGNSMAGKIADLLNAADLKTEIPDNIQVYAWEKTILNSALSPVCAITGKTMKEVMDSPDGLGLVKAILEESIEVAQLEGIKLPEDFLGFCLGYLKKGGYHKPSMLVDIDEKLPTEINFLNSRIAWYGGKHNIPTPVNQSITALVRMLEQSQNEPVKKTESTA
jgi:2-dehydropantoate 2-reductase